MKDDRQTTRGKTLGENLALTREALEELKTRRCRQEEELAELRETSEKIARKLESRSMSGEADGKEDILSGTPTFGYGAEMIGRTVLEAALYCNRLTGDGSDPSAKELVNLILGKTELIKAEMLAVILSDKTPEEKKTAIDEQFEQAKDYFESVMHQIK